jgi:hypothetical protein
MSDASFGALSGLSSSAGLQPTARVKTRAKPDRRARRVDNAFILYSYNIEPEKRRYKYSTNGKGCQGKKLIIELNE